MNNNSDRSFRAAALESLPPEWRERLIERAKAAGIESSDDVGWLFVGAVIDAWAAAAEAGRSAESVRAGIDQLDHSLARVPEQSKQAALDAGRSAGNELQAMIQNATREQASVIRQTIDEANQNADQQRRDRWRQMLAEFNEEVASIEADHKQQIESHIAATAHEFAQSSHKRSTRRLIVIAAVAFAFAIVVAVAGVTYVWQSIHKTGFTDCQKDNNGAIWCRLSGSGS